MLQATAMTGASITADFFTSHVGAGSRGQCLLDAFLSSCRTWSPVTDWNVDSLVDDWLTAITASAPAVDA